MKIRLVMICLLCTLLALGLASGVLAASREIQPADGSRLANRAAGSHPESSLVETGVGLVLDESGLANSFNWDAYQGLLQAETDLGVVGKVYTATSDSDYENKFQECVDDGNSLCVGGLWSLGDAAINTANANPGVSFAVLDWMTDNYPANLRGIYFGYKEMGYIAGALAGLMTGSDLVGDIGGPAFVPAVTFLVEGYRNGAQCANPSARVLVDYIPFFDRPDLGEEVALQMLTQGADVIFAAAGNTGIGSVLTATQSGAWAIGVDQDMYYSVFEGGAVDGADKLLSSAVKYYDVAIYATISDLVSSTFSSGTVVADLEMGGVGLAPYHETETFISQDVKDALDLIQQGIISDTISVDDPCREFLFLPFISLQYPS